MYIPVVGGKRGSLDCGKGAEATDMRSEAFMAGLSVVVEPSSLREGLAAIQAGVRLVTSMNSGMGLES